MFAIMWFAMLAMNPKRAPIDLIMPNSGTEARLQW
jgi:hypothetical protein